MSREFMISAALVAALGGTASAEPLIVRGNARCEAATNEAITVGLVSWDVATAESTVVGEARTTADGSFAIAIPDPQPPAGANLAVVLETAGCRPLVKPLRAGQRSVGPLVMAASATASPMRNFAIRGTVQLPDGKPAGGAAVRLMAIEFGEFSIAPMTFQPKLGSESATIVRTDAHGRFELFLHAPPPDPHEEGIGLHLLVEHDGHPPLMLPVYARQTEPYALRLHADSVHIRGVVVDAASTPVEGAQVYAASLHSETTTVVAARTSAAGMFALHLPASEVGIRLAVDHREFVPRELALPGQQSSVTPMTIHVERGVTVTGRLIREDDEGPIAAGNVKAFASQGMFWMARTAASDEDGYFALHGISPDWPAYDVAAEAAGFLPLRVDSHSIADPANALLLRPLRLRRSLSWTIDVIDPAGHAVADALVTIMETPYGPALKTVRTSSAGSASVDVAPGSYVVRVSATFHPDRYTDFEVVKARRDAIRLTANAMIRGRLVWSDQAPAAGVKVRCLPVVPDPESPGSFQILPDQRVVETDAAGTFLVERLAPGAYALHVDAGESVNRHVDSIAWPDRVLVEAGALVDVDGILPKPATIELVLQGAAMPTTLQATLTELSDDGDVVNDFAAVHLQVENGKAVLDEFIPGRYNVEIRVDTDATVDPQIIDVGPGQTTVAVKLVPGRKVRGIVVSEEGVPLAGASVSLWLDRGNQVVFGAAEDDLTSEELITDEYGRFTTAALRSGRYLVLATMDAFAPAVVIVEIDHDREPLFQTISLARGFPMQIDIRDPAGAPIPELIATLIRAEALPGGRSFQGVQQECERIPTGCRFEFVTPGPYVLRVSRGGDSEEFPIRITSQAVLRVTVRNRAR